MSSIAKVTEVIAVSEKSFDDAVKEGVKRANKTLKNVKSAWVSDHSVEVEKGKIIAYKVRLKVTFVLND
ncbi:dodecin family protein [Suttonella sp. R2A3]|uniref:dodecin family protein n=1 Tax=Suttonella sp. R2A3 TaxID=2908648 RepID=UPI001F23669F|nr:dodecin family protein [Suttonella sp. R2A3]UJF24506.1 dodecin family protein [Suttonella sp. R2A3]